MKWDDAVIIAKKKLGYDSNEWIEDFDIVVQKAKQILDKKYERYMLSEKWQYVRQRVFERDDWCCLLCGEFATDCHHENYDHFGEGNKKEIKDCVSLCHDCHIHFIHGRDDGEEED